MINSQRNNIFVFTIVAFSWIFYPILSIPIMLYIAMNSKTTLPARGKYFLLFMIALSLGLIAYTSGSGGAYDSDLVRYRDSYEEAVGENIGYIEPVYFFFNIINWFLANYLSSNGQFLTLFWSTMALSFTLFSSYKIISYYFKNEGNIHLILMLLCIITIPFIITTELIKQTIAFSVFMYALSKKITNEKHANVFFVIALLLHPQSILLIFITYFYKTKFIRKFANIILFVAVALSFVNVLDLLAPIADMPIFESLGISEKMNQYRDWEEFGGGRRYYILFAVIVLQVIVFVMQCKKNPEISTDLPILGILTICSLLFSMANQHNFARLIFTLFPFQIIFSLLNIRTLHINRNRNVVILFLMTFYILSTSIFTYKQLNSDESRQTYMENKWGDILTTSVIQYVNYEVK